MLIDTNFWKSHVHRRLAVAMGDRGCLSLYGNDTRRHRMFAEHMTSEYATLVEAKGRAVAEWKLKVTRENHWLDCLPSDRPRRPAVSASPCQARKAACAARSAGKYRLPKWRGRSGHHEKAKAIETPSRNDRRAQMLPLRMSPRARALHPPRPRRAHPPRSSVPALRKSILDPGDLLLRKITYTSVRYLAHTP